MPTPLDVITKPLQIGARVAFGAIQEVQKRFGGGEEPEQPPQQQPPRQPAKPKPKQLDDVTITRKVETTLFRDESVDKGKISVNTANGVVSLRGEAKTPEQIKQLEAKTREIPEVKDVENLLHLPKTPARASKRQPAAARKPVPKRTTAKRPSSTPLGS